MRTISLHISDQTAADLQTFHTAHRVALEKVTGWLGALREIHPASCTDKDCPTLRQIAVYEEEIAVGESLQRLHHDLLASIRFTPAEVE